MAFPKSPIGKAVSSIDFAVFQKFSFGFILFSALLIAGCGGGGVDSAGSGSAGPGANISHVPCDSGLLLASTDPVDAASAMGICGAPLVSAQWVLPDGSSSAGMTNFALGHGLLNELGPNVPVREGGLMLALSSGTARSPFDPGFLSQLAKGYSHALPPGFPEATGPGCPAPGGGNDGIALQVTLQAPAGANGFTFDAKYYSRDFPAYVCTSFVDRFVTLMSPPPAGAVNGNIAFDGAGNPGLDANSTATIEVCSPQTVGGISYPCNLGTAELTTSGFDANGASGWITVAAPVASGSTVMVTFAIWDSADGLSDSTVLLDNFRWQPSAP